MSDPETSVRRITFELPNKDVPDLMAVLSDFVAIHSLTIGFSDLLSSPNPTDEVEVTPSFNSRLATLALDGFGVQVPVVTTGDIKAFTSRRGIKAGAGTRLGNALLDPLIQDDRAQLSPFMLVDAHVDSHDDGERFIGMRVSRVSLLLEKLKSGAMKPHNLGDKSIKIFADYCEELFTVE